MNQRPQVKTPPGKRLSTQVDARFRGRDVTGVVNSQFWRNQLVNRIVPEGEGKPSDPVSLRIPEKLLKRLDACASATGNARYETILHLLRWALDEYERPEQQKKTA